VAFLQKLNRPIFALLAVAAIAGGLRFANLAYPPERVFDEVYYPKDACLYLGDSLRECEIKDSGERYWVKERGEVGSWVHPPLGKWMIAGGEAVFGNNSFGWRFSAALFGTLTCVLTAAIALLLFRSVLWSFIAGLLISTESLHFVMSRVGLLDIFLGFWVALGFFFIVLDRRWIHIRGNIPSQEAPRPSGLEGEPESPIPPTVPMITGLPPKVPSPFWRPWRFAAGAAFGAATATKWSGVFALTGALLLMFVWEVARRRRAGVSRPVLSTLAEESAGLILAMALLPLAVYLVSYWRWWSQNSFDVKAFWQMQVAAEQFHSTLARVDPSGELKHPYASRPWDWFILARPVNFYFESPGAAILAIGNPVVFWGSIGSLFYCAWSWIKRKDPRCGFIIIAVLAQYLPWFRYPNRVQFLFYMIPMVPFMVLACVYTLRHLSELTKSRKGVSWVVVVLVVLSVGVFAFQWPVLTAYPLTYDMWKFRMWMPGWV
jgi:dolichyl-phosphate-mannose--protein O-mannosyl transferase